MADGRRVLSLLCLFCLDAIFAPTATVFGQDLLNDNPIFSPFNLELRPFVTTMPANQYNVISMTTRLGDSRIYASTQQGNVYVINKNPDGSGTPSLFFNTTTALGSGVTMTSGNGAGAVQGGLQSIAFHPEFDKVGMPGYGKLYATFQAVHSGSANFLGDAPHGAGTPGPPDGVLAEWTYNHAAGTFNGYRELFRVNQPVSDHPIKQARFDPYSKPGDEDYGLLYLTHGDSNTQQSTEDYPLYLDNALGKMLRINPLDPDGGGSARYSIPATNPFANYSGMTPAGHATVLGEIYAYGLRNPHTFSFNKDDNGVVRILNGNIGRANIEEVNLIEPGKSYGWPDHEGTFVHLQNPNGSANDGYIDGVTTLPANEANVVDGYGRRNVYPVAQYDHNATVSQTSSGSSIASGFVIRNGSDPNLENQLIFNNFARKDGVVYHAEFQAMLNAVTELDPSNPAKDEPGELTQAVLHKLRLAYDHDNNPNTAPQVWDDLSSLLSNDTDYNDLTDRNDARYGEGVFGEMYISSKVSPGRIFLVMNSVPLAGDYNKDRVVDAADYVVWRETMGETGYQLAADGNGDAVVDNLDYSFWQTNFGKVWSAAGSAARSALILPEPTVLALQSTAAILLTLSRRGRRV